MIPLPEFARKYGRLSAQELSEKIGAAYFLVTGEAENNTNAKKEDFWTEETDEEARGQRISPKHVKVFPLFPPGEDKLMMSVGRARRSDVRLDTTAISKFHAWFTRHADGHFTLQDAESQNGTVCDGQTVVPKQPIEVEGGSIIVFGEAIEGLFHDADSMAIYLKTVAYGFFR